VRVVSWNVNGIRSVARKGFSQWLEGSGVDILGVQEVRARAEQIEPAVREPIGWFTHFVAAVKAGYSGVGLFSRPAADEVVTSLGRDEFDAEGRVQIARYGSLWVANVYFPNGSGQDRNNSRIPFKLEFYERLFDTLEPLRRSGRVLVLGDFNTAHREIDLARPRENTGTSGFCPEEREELDRWLRSGWTDTFRAFEPGGGHYTWWSQRPGVREKNIGWRIDYALASPGAMEHVRGAFIWPHVVGSDHVPIGVELDRDALR
jgi:exodeoxyribonuclease-3